MYLQTIPHALRQPYAARTVTVLRNHSLSDKLWICVFEIRSIDEDRFVCTDIHRPVLGLPDLEGRICLYLPLVGESLYRNNEAPISQPRKLQHVKMAIPIRVHGAGRQRISAMGPSGISG